MKRLLVTTALEQTWRDDEPLVFLGEWCRRYSRKEHWEGLDAVVQPYHWDDRARLATDYDYLRGLHERLLQELTVQLNQIHGVNHGLRYWRILIGPWLGYFTQMVFDRWTSIQEAIRDHDLSGTVVLTGGEEGLIPNDMSDFSRLYIGDEWNHHIYGTILRQFTALPCTLRGRTDSPSLAYAASADSWKRRIRRILVSSYTEVASTLTRDSDAFFLSTYLPLADEMRMYWRFGQMPQLWRAVAPIRTEIDIGWRQWVVGGESESDLECCVRALIPQQIPAAYLEGYVFLQQQVEHLPWPKHPKVIWTSNAHSSNDVFKAWAAQKAEQGSALVIGQHGGHYGVGLASFVEEHEIAISDCYLTWGWDAPAQPKVRPLGQLKDKRPLGVRHAQQAGALLVTCTMPQQSYFLYSAVIARQWLDYFEDQSRFVEHLPSVVRRALTVRLYPLDYGWDQVQRWRARFPNLQLGGASDIKDQLRRSRLYISTYNATTFLESFTMDVPTVIYWNLNHWELRDSAVPYFDELRRVGIFHDTPESAAHHVASVWDDVDAWWTGPALREVLERFKARYCYMPDNLLDRVEDVLREVIALPGKSIV